MGGVAFLGARFLVLVHLQTEDTEGILRTQEVLQHFVAPALVLLGSAAVPPLARACCMLRRVLSAFRPPVPAQRLLADDSAAMLPLVRIQGS